MNLTKRHFAIFILLGLLIGCKTHWSKAVKYGSVPLESFYEVVDIDINSRLIFVPVEISGTTYRFLFDSGAPCSISQELQDELQFKNLRSGHIRDTDNNKAPIEWVLVDTMRIGNVLFAQQPAFVGDFTANPALACLNVDGIIGSNNIKFCNWTIDTQASKMTLTNSGIDSIGDFGTPIKYSYDRQYNIGFDFKVENVTVKNIHLDYGSTGSLSITQTQFDTLKAYGLLDDVFIQAGVKQSGIVGKVTSVKKEISQIDTLKIGALEIPKVAVGTGTSRLLGNIVLSKYIVTIDSENRKLYFSPYVQERSIAKTFGFQPGHSDSLNVYLQSITTGSPAEKAGLEANMQVLRIDSLDFENAHTICDYMDYLDLRRGSDNSISMRLKTMEGEILNVQLEKESLFKQP